MDRDGFHPAILILEDDPIVSNLLKDTFESKGYSVSIAETGREALDQIERSRPDIMTLDIHLPDMSGVEVLGILKSNPATSSIPVIIISSDDEDRATHCLGAEKFFSKPIDFKLLFETLRSLQGPLPCPLE